MQIIYIGPNMNGVDVVDPDNPRVGYWCPKDEPSEDIPTALAKRLVKTQPSKFAAVPAKKGRKPTTTPSTGADAQED